MLSTGEIVENIEKKIKVSPRYTFCFFNLDH